MKTKTISKVLNLKLKEWMDSITDEDVKALVKKNTIVTGGAIASMLLKEKVKDFDVYFRDKETTRRVAEYYVRQFNGKHNCDAVVLDGETYKAGSTGTGFAGEANLTPDRIKIGIKSKGVASAVPAVDHTPFEDVVDRLDDIDPEALEPQGEDKYKAIFLSSNAITLSGRIQIVVRFYGEPDKIHENYDFVHCMNYYDFGKNELVLKPEALECLLAKELRYVGSKYPVCSLIRTRKFLTRGFTINAGQYLKMCFQVSQLDLTDIRVLEDQLVGVDSAYFGMLIDALQKKMDSDSSFQIEESYLVEIINRIF